MNDSLVRSLEEFKMGDEAAFKGIFDETKKQAFFRALQYTKEEERAYIIMQQMYETLTVDLVNCEDADTVVHRISELVYQEGIHSTRWSEMQNGTDGYAEENVENLDSNEFEIIDVPSMVQRDAEFIIKELIEELSAHQKAYLMGYYYDRFPVSVMAKMEIQTEIEIKKRILSVSELIKQRMREREEQDGFRYLEVSPALIYGAIELMQDEICFDEDRVRNCYSAICAELGIQCDVPNLDSVQSINRNENEYQTDMIPGITLQSEQSGKLIVLFVIGCAAMIIAIGAASVTMINRYQQQKEQMQLISEADIVQEVPQTGDSEASEQEYDVEEAEPEQENEAYEPEEPEASEEPESPEDILKKDMMSFYFAQAKYAHSQGATLYYIYDYNDDGRPELLIPGFLDGETKIYQMFLYRGEDDYSVKVLYENQVHDLPEPIDECYRGAFEAEIDKYFP